MSDFVDQFVDGMETGVEALETAGYDVEDYHTIVHDTQNNRIANSGETPEEALEQTLQELQNDNHLSFYISGEEFSEVLQGEQDSDPLIYRNLVGGLRIDEPTTNQVPYTDEHLEAFQTSIGFIPEFPNEYWEVETGVTKPPYTEEDTEEHLQGLVQAFEKAGIEVENRGSHGIEYPEDETQ